jgi:hypothetical protein
MNDRCPGSSRTISAVPSSQMITAPVPRRCPSRTPSKSLEVPRRQRAVFDRHGQPPDSRVQRGSPGYRPRAHHPARLHAQVEMQPGRIMKLYDEARHGDHTSVCAAACLSRGGWPGPQDDGRAMGTVLGLGQPFSGPLKRQAVSYRDRERTHGRAAGPGRRAVHRPA